jgi:hypothetical protein
MYRLVVSLAALFLFASAMSANAAQYLYVHNAKSMTFNSGVLTLQDVSPLTLFFSDRPKRIAGQMRTEAFVGHWTKGVNSFKKTPPNATVAMFASKTKIVDAIVELSEPKFDGTNLTYKIKVLKGKLPAQGGELAVFIDNGDASCDVGDPEYAGQPCWAQKAFDCPGAGGC